MGKYYTTILLPVYYYFAASSSLHIQNKYVEDFRGELNEKAVIANYATTAADGKTYNVDYFNLDVIISVGLCCAFVSTR